MIKKTGLKISSFFVEIMLNFKRRFFIGGEKMKKSFKLAIAMSAMLAGSFLMMTNTNKVSARSYSKAITKIAGQGNYPIYHRVSGNGPSGKFTST